jgi:hypothetical protein
MGFPAVTNSVANIKPATIVQAYVADSTTNKWQTLGSIRGGVLNVEDYTSPDSVGRNKTIGASKFTAKLTMKQCSSVELKLLDSLVAGTNAFLFQLADAGSIPVTTPAVTAGWVTVSSSQTGVKATVVADGTPADERHIDLEFQGVIMNTQKDAALKASIADVQFASSADSATAVFYGIGKYTATKNGGVPDVTHIKPCGISSIQIEDANSTGLQTIGPITNAKISLASLTTIDSIQRYLPLGIDIAVSYDWMSSDSANLLLLDSMAGIDVNVVIAMMDTETFTLSNMVGLQTNFETSGDMDKTRVVRFTHVGKILLASFDGICS